MRDIKDYLHLYLGCDFVTANSQGNLNAKTLPEILKYFEQYLDFKLILRPLSSMTEEEMRHSFQSGHPDDLRYVIIRNQWTPDQVHYLLSHGFDLFNLIPDGLAIDATTLTPNR